MRTHTLTTQHQPLVGDDELDHLRLIALQFRSRRRAAASGAGSRAGRLRGQGMDLHDTRAYQPGDDIRHMDWRATARSGKPVTRVFVEERAHSVHLFVDRRPTMMFGTRRELKAATAARVAAMLAFQALVEHESVSGLVRGDAPLYFPPRNTLAGTLPLLKAMAAGTPAPSPGRPLSPTRMIAPMSGDLGRGGAVLYLISDFHDVLEGSASLADYLPQGRRPGVIAVRIVDEAEQRMRPAGVLRLASPHGGKPIVVDTSDPGLRARYQAEVARRAAALAAQCALHRVELHTVNNYQDLAQQVEPLL